jgi:hypothetical protein
MIVFSLKGRIPAKSSSISDKQRPVADWASTTPEQEDEEEEEEKGEEERDRITMNKLA